MREYQKRDFVRLFQNLVRTVVDEDTPDSGVQVNLEKVLEVYFEQLQRNPAQLLASLRDAEEQLKGELGKGYYRTFIERVEHLPKVEIALDKNYEVEDRLERVARLTSLARGKVRGKVDPQSTTKRIVRPRHFLYYLSLNQSTLDVSDAVTFLVTVGSPTMPRLPRKVRFSSRGHWVELPVDKPTEKDVDEHFLKFIGTRELIERSAEAGMQKISFSANCLTQEIKELNCEIDDLSGYVEKTTGWAKRFLEDNFDAQQKGIA